MGGMPLINVVESPAADDDDEESYHAVHRDIDHDDYDSDGSISVPLHIKKINVLQRKVRQLEATLKQYNEQDPASRRQNSLDDIDMATHHDQQPTPISDGGYQPRTKGTVV